MSAPNANSEPSAAVLVWRGGARVWNQWRFHEKTPEQNGLCSSDVDYIANHLQVVARESYELWYGLS